MIGFGNVGREIARILTRNRDLYPGIQNLKLDVVAVTTRSRGALMAPAGVDLGMALETIETHNCFPTDHPFFTNLTSDQAAGRLEYDVLVELSTLNIESRGEPAAGYIRTALERGRHCVSANKGPLAFHFKELTSLAKERDSLLLYESTVMDGAPVFNLHRSAFRGCQVLAVEGILNSTSNFVLTQMEAGQTAEEAVREAQRAGFAEADPSYDLDGWDAAAKLAVIANSLMGESITPFEVERAGIGQLTHREVQDAPGRGFRWKQIARVKRSREGAQASVRAEKVSLDHPLAQVNGPGSAIILKTDLMAPLLVQQLHPTLSDTAYGVLNDLLEIGDTHLSGL